MSFIADNVRQEIIKLVPASVVNDITCFVFFDGHPCDPSKLDVTVCTSYSEVKEFYKRELVSSLHLGIPKPKKIRIIRNENLDLFYLVFGGDEIVIIWRGEDLLIHKHFKNVDRYELQDSLCTGRACLKIFVKDDAVPIVLDENFKVIEELRKDDQVGESTSVLNELMRKLTEAKYNVYSSEMMYESVAKQRHLALFSKYQKINLNTKEAVYKTSLKEIASALKMETLAPWVKICNKKVVIVFNIINQDEDPLEDVHVLLHGTPGKSISYTTKLFEKVNEAPFWMEKKSQQVKQDKQIAATVVIDLKDLMCSITRNVVFDAVIRFNKLNKEFLLPLENVNLSSLDTMKEEFDVLNNKMDDPNTILAILATSVKTDLHMRHLRIDSEKAISLKEIFCTHLQMEQIPNTSNMVIHKKSPYHTLHGVMIWFHDKEDLDNNATVSVFTRIPSQVIALIHYIHDAVPAKILITTSNYKITAKSEEFSSYNEEISRTDHVNYTEYAASILKRTTMLLEYLDDSMIKMNENKDPNIQSKIGKEIHLFANGLANYIEFRNKMLEVADEGIKQGIKTDTLTEESEPMLIE